MKYIITRTSIHGKYPFPGSVEEEYIHIDRRNASTIKEGKKPENAHWFKSWFNRGINHREENGHIACDVKYIDGINKPFKRWVINIEDIYDWVDKNNFEIVLSPRSLDDAVDKLPKIEIYDSYRE